MRTTRPGHCRTRLQVEYVARPRAVHSQLMEIDVSVVRVFTDDAGQQGNALGIVDAAAVAEPQRQELAAQLAFSETVFVDSDGSQIASATIFTPAVELPFAGHPTVGLSWWLRGQGTPVHTLSVPAGNVRVRYDGDMTWVRSRAAWAPEFELHHVPSVDEVEATDPTAFTEGHHYVWAWIDEEAGQIRSRMFAPSMGVAEDEATGAAAVRITDAPGRGLTITQGRGSQLVTTLSDGWIELGGRTVAEKTFTV